MGQVTDEMIYEELLKLDARAAKTEEALTDLVTFMREMNKELAEGQAQTDALKQKLFKGRFDHTGAFLG